MGYSQQLERAPAAVYLDQFNLITFFIYHHTWDWSFLKLPQSIPGIDVYRLRRGSDQMLVFRDKTRWNVDPDDPVVYTTLAECLRLGSCRRSRSSASVRRHPSRLSPILEKPGAR